MDDLAQRICAMASGHIRETRFDLSALLRDGETALAGSQVVLTLNKHTRFLRLLIPEFRKGDYTIEKQDRVIPLSYLNMRMDFDNFEVRAGWQVQLYASTFCYTPNQRVAAEIVQAVLDILVSS